MGGQAMAAYFHLPFQTGHSSVDGSRVVKHDLTFWRFGRVQSSVRPVDAVGMDCGP